MPRVVFLVLPNVHLLDLAGPAQVFHTATEYEADYDLHFCSPYENVKSAQGLNVAQLEPLPKLNAEDTVFVVGVQVHQEGELRFPDVYLDASLQDWLKQSYAAGARLASICSGALALGEAGLLKAKRCTTHWRITELLQERNPSAKVQNAVLFAHDDRIITSAGIASGIDLALYLLEQQYDAALAAKVARDLVLYTRRNGNATQQSIFLQYRSHLHSGVHRVQDYLMTKHHKKISLDDLADIAKMSSRNLSRAFKEHTGLSPLQYQQQLKLEHAANLLENPKLSIELVAEQCGFDDPRHFRRLWKRQFGSPPSVRASLH